MMKMDPQADAAQARRRLPLTPVRRQVEMLEVRKTGEGKK
jgi:hypothetical protein